MNNKKLMVIVAQVILVIIASVLAYQIYDLTAKYGVKRITSLPPIENEFLTVKGDLLTLRRADYIFPTDTLAYVVNWKNNANYSIEIIPKIEGSIGERKSFEQPKVFPPIILTKDGVSTNDYSFSLDKEGLHTVKFEFTVINHTNKALLYAKDAYTTIEILSRSDQLQDESNFWTRLGVIASSAIAGAAAIIAAYEIKLSREEKNSTLRAWVGESGASISRHRYENSNNEFKTKEE